MTAPLLSAPSRRRMIPYSPSTCFPSKAHRVLGSLPVASLAHPSSRDDASSSTLSDDLSVTTATSYDPDSESGEVFDDHSVGIAKSDSGWGDESGVLPPSMTLENQHADRPDDATVTITPSILRKSRSSSTIKSWYDKSKLPLSISQQTSSSAMAKGLPSKTGGMLDLDVHSACSLDAHPKTKVKRKPSKLDLSSLIPHPRLIRKASRRQLENSGEPGPALDIPTTSPITLTPIITNSTPIQALSPATSPYAAPTHSAMKLDGNRDSKAHWQRPNDALSALPTLYDHYEQMSMRHAMKQYSRPEISRLKAVPGAASLFPRAEWQLARRGSQCFDWVHDSPPPTPQTALHPKPADSPPPFATSTTGLSSRQTRSSKTTEKNFASADLQQTSVLFLSDSEEDDVVDQVPQSRNKASLASEWRSSEHDSNVPPLVASISRPSKQAKDSEELSRSKTLKLNKRASFTPENAHVIPFKPECQSKGTPVDSLRDTTFLSFHSNSVAAATDTSARRASIISTTSTSSAATELSKKSGYSILEARAVTMLPARRPSSERDEADKSRQRMIDWDESLRRLSIASSNDQPTPPLSPATVDLYTCPTKSSPDESGSHSRLMAVSRQEEMLLSALRHKQKAMRASPLFDLREGDRMNQGGTNCRRLSAPKATAQGQRRGSRDQLPKGIWKSSAELTVIDLDLPGRGRAKNGAIHSERQWASDPSQRRWSAAAAVSGSDSKRPGKGPSAGPPSQELFALLDDADPSPDLSDYRDWHAAMTAGTTLAGKPTSKRDLFGSQSRRQRRGSGQSGAECSPTQIPADRFARLSGVAEETEADVPRPDSPISPESFPAVPRGRGDGGDLVRLSAAMSSPLTPDTPLVAEIGIQQAIELA